MLKILAPSPIPIPTPDAASLTETYQADDVSEIKDQASRLPREAIASTKGMATYQLETPRDRINALLNLDQPEQAGELLEHLYSGLSRQDLDEIRALFWLRANQYQESHEQAVLLRHYLTAASVFDELEFWQAAAVVASKQSEWPIAYNSMRRATLLENRPDLLQQKLFELVKIASHMRAGFESTDDQLSILQMYQGLNREHPGYPRFKLELAQAWLRLGDQAAALPLLEQLQYEPQFRVLAQQKLNAVQEQMVSSVSRTFEQGSKPHSHDKVVPLRRNGNSFLLTSSIKGRRVTMLLDTGASITALSKDLIRQLSLQPTGQRIQLSTANGTTVSRLYKIDELRLGSFLIKNSVIAEIDLSGTDKFQALLGTDILNRAGRDYSYLIDNSRNELIFRNKQSRQTQ